MNEGYLPLYRKYRPQKLDDIVGQAHIKKALSNAIKLNKIAHAYLFTGPRGTGKTSTARILAKSLNCVNGPTVTPCEKCESCISITNTVPIDVIEMDAASNRSVDDAREILEKVNYAPVHGKYKIYIIDEVHMLTDQAFNALLKTLEEPPKNVIFILATTEAHKVLPTIISRCQRFDFKRITTEDIIEHLRKISDKEGLKITDGALAVIAKSSAGGMRDSLSLLDQVSSMGGQEEITEEDINNLLGRLSFDSLSKLSDFIIKSDGASAISELEKIYNDGNEPIQILTNLLLHFKNMLIVKTCDKKSALELTNLSKEQVESLIKTVEQVEKHQIVFLINKVSDYIKEMKQTTNQQLWLEVALIDLANLADNTKLEDLENRLLRLEGGQVQPARATVQAPVHHAQPVPHVHEHVQEKHEQPKTVQENYVEPVVEHKEVSAEPAKVAEAPTQSVHNETQQPQPPQQQISQGGDNLSKLWLDAINVLVGNDAPKRAALKGMAGVVEYNGNEIVLAVKNQIFANRFNEPVRRSKLMSAFSQILGKDDFNLVIRARTAADAKIVPPKEEQPKKKITPPHEVMQKIEEVSDEEKETVSEHNEAKKNTENEEHMKSDFATSVRNLFDGKFIE